MIEATNIKKKFGKLLALNDVSLSFKEGQTVSLIGPKAPVNYIHQMPAGSCSSRQRINHFLTEAISKEIPVTATASVTCPRSGVSPDNIRISQLISMVRDIRKNNGAKEDHELMETFGLDRMKDKTMRTLSGGTRQKVSACLAFLFDPPVIILDEPTAGLDPLAAEQLKDKIRKEKEKGKLILITSHILSDLDDITSEVVYLQDGNLLFYKSNRAAES